MSTLVLIMNINYKWFFNQGQSTFPMYSLPCALHALLFVYSMAKIHFHIVWEQEDMQYCNPYIRLPRGFLELWTPVVAPKVHTYSRKLCGPSLAQWRQGCWHKITHTQPGISLKGYIVKHGVDFLLSFSVWELHRKTPTLVITLIYVFQLCMR